MSELVDPKKVPVLPPLGPSFLALDDAARWAHEQIGNRRDREYGGVILKQGDRYFATTPVVGSTMTYDHGDILARNANHLFVTPAGFTGAAFYHSHPKQAAPGFTAQQLKLINSFFSPPDQIFSIVHRYFAPVHYLSGPDGSMIKYVSSGSAPERQLLMQLLGKAPPPPHGYFESRIHQLAAVGELWVLVPNAPWGSKRGLVTQHWLLGKPVEPEPRPQPFFTPLFDKASDAIASVLSDLPPNLANRRWGVVLKHVGEKAYAASLPVVEGAALPLPESHFARDAQGVAQLPLRYQLDGIYLSSSTPEKLPVKEPRLYRNFFSPAELAQGIAQSRRGAPQPASQGDFSIYRATRDGALLQYRCSGNDLETRLMGPAKKGSAFRTGLQEPILSGRLTPSEFVYRVADAGELEVLRTGGLWDVPGIVGPQWVPHAWRQRTLGLAFATADDAARHAHEQVGDRREQDHAALILQREDGRFVVTDPLVAKGARFALDTVYSSQEHSALQGYKLHGLFASRGRTAKPRQWSGAQAEVFTQMFSDDDIYRLLTQRKTVDLAYLSGSRNSLLRFVSDGLTTGAEQELLGQVSPGDGSSAVALEWAQGTRLPSEFVQTLAFTSHLTVLVGSALWGAPVDLSGDWEPYGADRWSVLPAVPMTGAMCASAQEAVLQAHGRVADRYASEVAGMGLLLKHQTLEQYVATQRVPADQLNLLAQRCENALPLSSAGFVVDSVYYSSRRVSAGASEQARWLHRHFLAPAELFAALYKSAGERRFALTRPAVVHIACLDGAVLHYAYSAGSRLFQLAPGRDSPAVLEHDLMHGALSARDYVVKVAGQGQLTVNLSSECWDEDGLVGPHWQPFAHITPRYLSPAFATADDAVRYVHRILGKRRDQVYGGLVLKGVGGGYVVTEPLAVHVEDFDPQWVRLHALVETGQFLGGSSIVACYHTRAPSRGGLSVSTQEQAVYEGMFSTHFLQAVLGNEAWPQTASPRTDYLLCHDGALLRFRVNGTAHPSILADDVEQRLRNGVLLPSEWVRRVAAAGDLQVLEGSPLWGVPQKVMAAWTPYPEEQDPWLSPAVQADLPMSPLFAQINDAVRYAHRQAGERQSRVFGWVLKVPGNLYMVSQPTPLWGRRSIGLDHLFEGGVLPAGYFVIGVYLCTQAPEAQASAEEVRSSFLLPLDLQLGLSAAMQPGAAHGTGVLLFISCTDGALLKLDHFRPDNDLLHGADRYDARVRKGDVSTADYVHKVARTGALKVLVPSEFWSARGVVSQQWQPFQSAGLSQQQDNRLDLGPLCLQPDDAARHAQQWVRDQPDKAWLGGVLTHSRLGAVAIEPLLDTQTPSVAEQRLFWTSGRNATAPEPLPVPELPEGFEVTAAHHFYKSDMPAEEGPLQANFISWTYLFNYTRRLRRFGLPVTCYYLSTRDGALLKYTVDSSVGSHQNEMVESFRHLGTYTAAYLLDQLMTDKSLTVVQTGSFWQRRGPVVAPAKSSPAANTPVLLRERDEF